MKKIKLLLLTVLIFNLVLPFTIAKASITYKDEEELGAAFHLKILAYDVLFSDPYVNNYFKTVAKKVLKASGGEKHFNYTFSLVKSDGINAFAVPGGYIYLHTETIISLENEGQMASIIAHEIAHITGRHFAYRLEAAKSTSLFSLGVLLAGILVASGGGQSSTALGSALMLGGSGIAIQSALAHSRADEMEADIRGRNYLVKAGYSAGDMYGAFKILADKSYIVSAGIPTYLSTHPDLTYRLSTTFAEAKNQSPKNDPAYEAIRDRVLALSGEPRRVQTMMTKRLKANKDDHSALHVMGLLAARQQNLGPSEKFMEDALKLVPNNKEYLADLGDLLLRKNKVTEAKISYEKAQGDPNNARQVYLGLGRSYELLGNKTQAASYYDRANTGYEEPYPEALELAGRFFGQEGQKAKGHYYFAKYFLSIGDLKKSTFHYEELLKTGNNLTYKKEAENEIKRIEELLKESKKK